MAVRQLCMQALLRTATCCIHWYRKDWVLTHFLLTPPGSRFKVHVSAHIFSQEPLFTGGGISPEPLTVEFTFLVGLTFQVIYNLYVDKLAILTHTRAREKYLVYIYIQPGKLQRLKSSNNKQRKKREKRLCNTHP